MPRMLRTPLLIHGCLVLSVPTHGGRGKGVLWGLFYKSINPIHEGSTFFLFLWGGAKAVFFFRINVFCKQSKYIYKQISLSFLLFLPLFYFTYFFIEV